MSEQDHEHEGHERRCPHHDTSGHWMDDMAFVDDDRLPIPDEAPRWDKMSKAIKKAQPDDNPVIYRFCLVFVNAETGLPEVLANPGSDPISSINLLTRAASIMAYQHNEREEKMREAIMKQFGGANIRAFQFDPSNPPEIEEPPEDIQTGQYL